MHVSPYIALGFGVFVSLYTLAMLFVPRLRAPWVGGTPLGTVSALASALFCGSVTLVAACMQLALPSAARVFVYLAGGAFLLLFMGYGLDHSGR